jgi:signal transduction histidine kinase
MATVSMMQPPTDLRADLLQTVIDNSPTGLVLYEAVRDAEGRIVDFVHRLSNPVNEAVTGRASHELVGLRMLEHYPSNRENGHFDDLKHVTETGNPLRRLLDYRAHGINGYFDSIYVKQGDGVLFTYLDVTETYEQRLQLEAANRDLQRSNENLAQFAYVASHDLQEPLRKIQSFGGMLRDRPSVQADAQATEFVERMQRAAGRMSLLISDLLTYSRLSTVRDTYQPVDLNVLISNSIDDLDEAIRDSHATLDVAADLPTLPGDATQLRQLFQNLLSNAIKFRHPDAPQHYVSVGWRRLAGADRFGADVPTEVGIGRADRVFYEISIRDTGIGFDPRYTDRIFQVFQRLHGKNQYAGSGIGLAICKKVVENHGGALVATSQVGQGATFSVYLPG